MRKILLNISHTVADLPIGDKNSSQDPYHLKKISFRRIIIVFIISIINDKNFTCGTNLCVMEEKSIYINIWWGPQNFSTSRAPSEINPPLIIILYIFLSEKSIIDRLLFYDVQTDKEKFARFNITYKLVNLIYFYYNIIVSAMIEINIAALGKIKRDEFEISRKRLRTQLIMKRAPKWRGLIWNLWSETAYCFNFRNSPDSKKKTRTTMAKINRR